MVRILSNFKAWSSNTIADFLPRSERDLIRFSTLLESRVFPIQFIKDLSRHFSPPQPEDFRLFTILSLEISDKLHDRKSTIVEIKNSKNQGL